MSEIPRSACPIEAQYSGPQRTQLVLDLMEREEGVVTIQCFGYREELLEDEQLTDLKGQVESCGTCVNGANCGMGKIIMKAQFTEADLSE